MKKLVIIMLAFVLTGCMTTKNTEDNFVVGMEAAYQPFNWQAIKRGSTGVYLDGGAGIADGYDVVIAQKIAKKIHKKLVIKKISWEGLPSAVESGEIDAIIAGMTASPEREKGMDFTTPYYSSDMVMVVRKNSPQSKYYDIAQFKGSRVMGQKNTNYDTIIDQIKGVKHQVPKSTYPELVMALRSKDTDGITAELPVATGIVKANKDLAIVRFNKGTGFKVDTSVSIGMKNNSRHTKLFKDVQKALDSISQEERQKIMEGAVNRAPLYNDQ
ncbi:MAG: transporter substrate-binding domain-containing protein [Sharpea porci]|uniref:transporter substrate-binding domain-containing protein n=1 Tax=Sharpea porci TaxID=2652286 RepID=UPI0024093B14|nr:transporter substrate-binding domain-containing protein [Sharpea porci]MDD6712204.1 transporter substrate-binding domain-containing protein [Sharpea porci]